MKRKTLLCVLLLSLVLFACSSSSQKSNLDSLQHISFEELDKKLDAKESLVVYFGWTQNCGDSEQFQKGYLEKKIQNNDAFKQIYVVDLDKELPEALSNKELRQPMIDKYNVSSSPTMVQYIDGVMGKKIEWTILNASDKTGILESELDQYFTAVGYIK